jgi:PAS domain S-box-containing protein
MSALRRLRTGSVIAVMAIMTVVPLMLLVLLPLQMATDALGGETERRVTDIAQNNAKMIDRQLSVVTRATENVADASALVAGDPLAGSEAVDRRLRGLQMTGNGITKTVLVDRAGSVLSIVPTDPSIVGTTLSSREYFRSAVSEQTSQLSGRMVTQSSKTSAITIASPVLDPGSGEVKGVVLAIIDIDETFQAWVNDMHTQDGMHLTINDANGGVVAAPRDNYDDARISNDQPVGSTGWTVSASVSQAQALGPAHNLRNQVLATAAVLGVMLGICVVVLISAVRARRKAEMSLVQAETRINNVLQTASQIYIEIDASGRITEWNKFAERTLGWSRKDILGKSIFDTIVVPERVSTAAELISQLSHTKIGDYWSSRQETLLARSVNCDPVEVEMTVWTTPVGNTVRLSLLAQVITERKRLETEREMLVRRQQSVVEELRKADKAKSDFVSTISHELRTPLTSIIGYLEMLGEGFGGELNSQQQSMLDVVDRNSRRLLTLIEDLLMLSRIDAGKLRTNAIDVDMSALVTHAVQAVLPSASDKHLDMEVDVTPSVGLVHGDPSQLERVLLNLMSNAIKFTPERGRVAVRVYRNEDEIHLDIQDSGIGIPVEEQNKLFQRFFRSSKAVDDAIPGTGLGLAIVQSIVDRHNGQVTIQSASDVGTTVMVKFPAVANAPAAAHV